MLTLTTVDEGAACTAMLELYQNEGIIAEPAGALSVAALAEMAIEPGPHRRLPDFRWQQ
ncbi:pyridoxal-phosphate dependent enzyme family protein [Mycobacteroides abscessus]|nr:pyridoxal-phosphate dependent enzyme family protein [Mycobacteroides abscessus]